MNKKNIRWEQRFDNFEKVYNLFNKYVDIADPAEAERMSLIQAFEMSFELSWKLMKDYLEYTGIQTLTPRDAIKQAYQTGVVKDGHIWIDALGSRNKTVHTYNEVVADEVLDWIKEFYFQRCNSSVNSCGKKNAIWT